MENTNQAITLINVGTDSAFKESIREQYNYPPYGLLSLAAVLKSHGYTVYMIDLLSEAVSREELVRRLHAPSENILAVGIPTYTETIHLGLEIADLVRTELPDVSIIMGGVHASFRPQDAFQRGTVDFVVRGEAEGTIVMLMEALKHPGFQADSIAGLAIPDDDSPQGFRLTHPRPYIRNIDNLPFPAFEMVADNPAYSTTISIISSRGCPGQCIFCASRAYSGKAYRLHSAEWLFSLLLFYKLRVRDFSVVNFMDDTFTADRRRLKKFYRYVRNQQWTPVWACKSRVDTLNEETIRLLAEAGCRSIHIGIESADQRILDSIDKHLDLNRCLEIVELLNSYDIRLECSFIVGLPADTRETIDKTLFLAHEINKKKIGMATIGIATPFPGTAMFDRAEQLVMQIRTSRWKNYTTMKPVFETENFTIEDLRRAYHEFNNQQARMDQGENVVSDANLADFRARISAWADRVASTRIRASVS